MMEAIMELDDDVSFGVIKDGWDMSQTKWSNHRRKRWIFQQTMFELPSGKLT